MNLMGYWVIVSYCKIITVIFRQMSDICTYQWMSMIDRNMRFDGKKITVIFTL